MDRPPAEEIGDVEIGDVSFGDRQLLYYMRLNSGVHQGDAFNVACPLNLCEEGA
jgi:hypothetical protein